MNYFIKIFIYYCSTVQRCNISRSYTSITGWAELLGYVQRAPNHLLDTMVQTGIITIYTVEKVHISKDATSAGVTANLICLFIKNDSMKIEVKLFGFIHSIWDYLMSTRLLICRKQFYLLLDCCANMNTLKFWEDIF